MGLCCAEDAREGATREKEKEEGALLEGEREGTGCDHQSDPHPVKRLTSRSQTSRSNAAE